MDYLTPKVLAVLIQPSNNWVQIGKTHWFVVTINTNNRQQKDTKVKYSSTYQLVTCDQNMKWGVLIVID